MPSIVQQVDGRWYFGFEHGDKHRDRCFNTLRPHSLRAITQKSTELLCSTPSRSLDS